MVCRHCTSHTGDNLHTCISFICAMASPRSHPHTPHIAPHIHPPIPHFCLYNLSPLQPIETNIEGRDPLDHLPPLTKQLTPLRLEKLLKGRDPLDHLPPLTKQLSLPLRLEKLLNDVGHRSGRHRQITRHHPLAVVVPKNLLPQPFLGHGHL